MTKINISELAVFDPAIFIKDGSDALHYIGVVLEENDPNALAEALRTIARARCMTDIKGLEKMEHEEFSSVWDALAESPEQAIDIKARASLMMQICKLIKTNKWKLDEAAGFCGIDTRKTQALLDGHLSQFQLNDLKAISKTLDSRDRL
jgi:predicted XRE-type DNA-binding protein